MIWGESKEEADTVVTLRKLARLEAPHTGP